MPHSEEGVRSAGDKGSVIKDFYHDANVFITGATGFMGKVLIEKLLRSCPDVNNIYLLVRSKRGKQMEERIDELIESPCFDRLKEERPGFESKLVAVAGDIGVEGLGISDQDRHLLAEHVNIVFHVAATVKFDEQLNVAIKQNVRGTRDLLVMCKSFSKLKVVVHVSTAYSNCPLSEIMESFYESPMNCDLAIQMCEKMEESKMDAITPELLGKWPNSYTFTKALAEDVVKQHGGDLVIGIFRPAIIVSTQKEPMSGWIDNMYGPNGVIAGCASGLMRTMQCDASVEANMVPCDMAINGLIATAWHVEQRRSWSAKCPIYNFVNPPTNSFVWKDFMTKAKQCWHDMPLKQAIWYSVMVLAKGRTTAQVYQFFLHTCPAILVDTFLRLTGNKPRMMAAYKKINRFTDVLSYFSTRSWTFEDANMTEIWGNMSSIDKATFPLNMGLLDWDKYMRESCLGIREHLLKEGPETLPAARRKYIVLYCLHYTTMMTIIGFLLRVFLHLLRRLKSFKQARER